MSSRFLITSINWQGEPPLQSDFIQCFEHGKNSGIVFARTIRSQSGFDPSRNREVISLIIDEYRSLKTAETTGSLIAKKTKAAIDKYVDRFAKDLSNVNVTCEFLCFFKCENILHILWCGGFSSFLLADGLVSNITKPHSISNLLLNGKNHTIPGLGHVAHRYLIRGLDTCVPSVVSIELHGVEAIVATDITSTSDIIEELSASSSAYSNIPERVLKINENSNKHDKVHRPFCILIPKGNPSKIRGQVLTEE